jgi:hypothetical protein
MVFLTVKLYRRRYNIDRDITTSDRIPEVMIAEAEIVSTEAEIVMAEAEIVSSPLPSLPTHDCPVDNKEHMKYKNRLPSSYTS